METRKTFVEVEEGHRWEPSENFDENFRSKIFEYKLSYVLW